MGEIKWNSGVKNSQGAKMPYSIEDDYKVEDPIFCAFCETEVELMNDDGMIDRAGVYCGKCMHRMGLDGDFVTSCGLCQLPICGDVYMIPKTPEDNTYDHYCDYCEKCHGILVKMGF